MPLDKQTVPVIFEGGVDQKTSDQLIVPGTFKRLSNTVRKKTGLIEKRNGFDAVSTATTHGGAAITSPFYKMSVDSDGLLNLQHKNGVSTYDTSGTWNVPMSRSVPPHSTSYDVLNYSRGVSGNAVISGVTTLIANGYEHTCYVINRVTFVEVTRNLASNTVVRLYYTEDPGIVGTFGAVVGNVIFYGYYTSTSSSTKYAKIFGFTATSGAIPYASAASINITVNSVPSSDGFNTCIIRAYSAGIVFAGQTTSNQVEYTTFNTSGVVQNTGTFTSGVGSITLEDLAVDTTGDNIYTAVRTVAPNDAYVFAQTIDLGTVSSTLKVNTDSSIQVFARLHVQNNVPYLYLTNAPSSGTSTSKLQVHTGWAGTAGTSPLPTLVRSTTLQNAILDPASSLTYDTTNNTLYIAVFASSFRTTSDVLEALCVYMIDNLSSSSISNTALFKVFEGKIGTYESSDTTLNIYNKLVYSSTTTDFRLGVPVVSDILRLSSAGAYSGQYLSDPAVLKINPSPTRIQSDTTTDGIYLGLNNTVFQDKTQQGDLNFNQTPEIVSATALGTGGFLPDGTYSVVATYEAIDFNGQIHRSNPSAPTSVTLSGGGSSRILLYVSPLKFSNRAINEAKIVLYLTEANGTVHYRHITTGTTYSTSQPNAGSASPTPPRDYIEILLTVGAGTTNEVLYTDSSIVPNINPEFVTYVKHHKGRLFALCGSGPTLYAYTKLKVSNEPFSFSNGLFVDETAQPSGRFVAAASLDSKLILFQRKSIKYLVGDGPDDTGGSSDYSSPIDIPTTVGCSDPLSVIETPIGVIFKSEKGIYLLDRGLSPKYIGAGVEDYNSYTVTSAVHIADREEVRFTLSSGATLVYNYFFNQWSTHTYTADEAVDWAGDFTYRTGTTIRTENTSSYADAGSAIEMIIETGWLAVGGLEGYQRVHDINILGKFVSSSTLYVDLYYDYDDATIVETVSKAYSAGPDVRMRIRPKVQKCTAVKMVIRESSTGAGFKFSGIQLDVGIKAGTARLSAGETV